MKKSALAIVLLSLASAPAYAAPALVQIGVGACGGQDGDGNDFTALNPTVKVKVATQGAAKTLILTCHSDAPNHTGRAVTYNTANGGGVCIVFDPLLGAPVTTTRWEMVVAAGVAPTYLGSWDLSCTYIPPSGL
jgi:hypothetical protein